MLLANVPAVLLGDRITRIVPMKWVRLGAAASFAILGLWTVAVAVSCRDGRRPSLTHEAIMKLVPFSVGSELGVGLTEGEHVTDLEARLSTHHRQMICKNEHREHGKG